MARLWWFTTGTSAGQTPASFSTTTTATTATPPRNNHGKVTAKNPTNAQSGTKAAGTGSHAATTATTTTTTMDPPPPGISPFRVRARTASRDMVLQGAASASSTASTASSSSLISVQQLPPLVVLPPPQPSTSSPRRRINSRDIPRTYAGLYGASDDWLPFECHRHPGTPMSQSIWFLLGTYVTLLAAVQLVSVMLITALQQQQQTQQQTGDSSLSLHHTPSDISTATNIMSWQIDLYPSWTLTNLIHLAVTLVYIHWLKGSLYDEQGEMNAMTVWEQLEATTDTRPIRTTLMIAPTVLTYAACHFANYNIIYCAVNIIIWCIAMLAKLPAMNGVRIFGINRTVGIDDDVDHDDDDDDDLDHEDDDDYNDQDDGAIVNNTNMGNQRRHRRHRRRRRQQLVPPPSLLLKDTCATTTTTTPATTTTAMTTTMDNISKQSKKHQ